MSNDTKTCTSRGPRPPKRSDLRRDTWRETTVGIPMKPQPPGLDSSHCSVLRYLRACICEPARVNAELLLSDWFRSRIPILYII